MMVPSPLAGEGQGEGEFEIGTPTLPACWQKHRLQARQNTGIIIKKGESLRIPLLNKL